MAHNGKPCPKHPLAKHAHEPKKPIRSVNQWGLVRDALEGKGPQRWPQRRLGRRLEEYQSGWGRLLSVTNATEAGTIVRGTVAGRRLGALVPPSPPSNASLGLVVANSNPHDVLELIPEGPTMCAITASPVERMYCYGENMSRLQ